MQGDQASKEASPRLKLPPTARVHAVPTSRGLPRLWLLLASLLSGGLLWLCHFPMAWGGVAFVALVPLLCLVRADVGKRWVAFCALLGGCVFFYPVLSWMWVGDAMMLCWLLLAFYCALYTPVGVLLVRALDRRLGWPLLLTVPLVWVALDYVRSFLLTGFAWYYLGYTQHEWLALIQSADWGGVYAVTALVALVNALAFEWLYLIPQFRSVFKLRPPEVLTEHLLVRRRWLQTGTVVLLLIAALGYGAWRMEQTVCTRGPRLAVLQGNVLQELRDKAASPEEEAQKAQQFIQKHHEPLCDLAIRMQPLADLIVWPETSVPWAEINLPPALDLNKFPPDQLAELKRHQDQLRREVSKYGATNVLYGVNTEVITGYGGEPARIQYVRYNSAQLYTQGAVKAIRYDKIHRVPFGEYLPLRETLPFMESLNPYAFDYWILPGKEQQRFQLGEHSFGAVICFEDTDPTLARAFGVPTENEPAVSFLINMSNDGWFRGSQEHEEHLATARFRAIETRRALARAVNMGISALIDSTGRVVAPCKEGRDVDVRFWEIDPFESSAPLPLERWHEFKNTYGVFSMVMPIDSRTTLYAQWGDWFALGCCGLLSIGLLWPRRRVVKTAVEST